MRFIGLLPLGLLASACVPAAEDVPPEVLPTLATATVAEEAASASSEEAEQAQASPTMQTVADPSRPDTFTYRGELTQGGWLRGLAPAGAQSVTLDGKAVPMTPDGRFFVAFDRDATGSATLAAQLSDGAVETRPLTISPREWSIQRVNVAKRSGGSSEAWWKKREPEWLAIKGAREKVTGATGWQQDFIWPVKGRISGQFGRQRIYRGEPGSYHSGIDIAPGNGVPFVAPADGVVVLARTGFSLEGNLIIIDHGAGLNSAFLHSSKIAVSEGEAVKQGQYIGNVGSTGRSTGPHLHWGLKWNATRLDPLLFVGPM